MSDAIFTAAGFMERVWREIDHLCEAIVELLDQHGIEASFEEENTVEEEQTGQHTCYQYALRKVYPGQRSDGQLAIVFDLAREGAATEWAAGQQALVLIGYDKRYDFGWSLEQFAFRTDGTLRDPDARAKVAADVASGSRLLIWDQGDEGAPWHRRCWAFALPLHILTDAAAVEKEIITPFISLVKGNALPNVAFALSQAVEWPSSSKA